MDPWISHRIVYRIMTMHMIYENKTPLRIGAGKAHKLYSPIDMPILRIKVRDDYKPYIPGSSIKGVFRSSAEFISKTAGIKVCNLGEGCRDKYHKELDEYLRKGNVNDVLNLLYNEYCLICKGFGSGSYKSHIEFYDAYPVTEPIVSVKAGIAINRRSGSVKRNALYFLEYIEPGSKFGGAVKLHNLPNYYVGLLGVVIDLINNGLIRFGGFKSRGYGEISIDIEKIELYQYENGRLRRINEKTIVKALDKYDVDIEFDPQNPREYINGCVKAWDRYISKVSKVS